MAHADFDLTKRNLPGHKTQNHQPRPTCANTASSSQSGFTLIELIVVMIIVGIMAVSVAPRMSLLVGFDTAGFRDQTVAILRFAQKSALAQRRAVCVTTSNTGVTLVIATTATDNTCATSIPLVPPFSPRLGSGLQATSFNFLRMGETNQASGNITLSLTGVTAITIDAVTGYVR